MIWFGKNAILRQRIAELEAQLARERESWAEEIARLREWAEGEVNYARQLVDRTIQKNGMWGLKLPNEAPRAVIQPTIPQAPLYYSDWVEQAEAAQEELEAYYKSKLEAKS
jgi:hypothetical protein